MVYRWLKNTLDLLYPPTCALCGDRYAADDAKAASSINGLCPGCRADLPERDPACPGCGVSQTREEPCGACRKRPPAQDALWAAYPYRFPLDVLLQGYKYHQRMHQGRTLQSLFLEAALAGVERGALRRPDVVIPVPLHAAKLRERGFNQSLELATPVAQALDARIAPRLIRRVRATQSQTGLPHASRAKNVRKAFQCREPVTGRTVALVDDVVTTASTVGEVARVLKQAGAKRVDVWAFARTEKDL